MEIVTGYILPFIYAAMACAGFCVMYNMHEFKIALTACVGGGIAWVAYLLCAPSGSVMLQNFVSAVTVAIFSEIMARVFKTPSTVFLIVGILPMVPGGGIYYTMKYCIEGNMDMFVSKLIATLGVAGAIAVGVSLVSSVVRIINANKFES